jgi:hypothetical protein
MGRERPGFGPPPRGGEQNGPARDGPQPPPEAPGEVGRQAPVP